MGHREIGIITSDQSISTFRERTQGFVKTMRTLGVSIDNSHIITTPYTEEGGYSAFEKLVQAHPKITLVAIMNNATTLGSFLYVREHNILVPETISILSFGEILNANLLFVNPVFMAQKPTEVGIKAANLMLERLEEPHLKSREVVIEAEFTEGSSVKDLSYI